MAAKDMSRQNRIVMLCMAALLILGLVMAMTVPAGEFPPYAYAVFNLGLDVVMTGLLAVLTYGAATSTAGGMKVLVVLVGVLGTLAGAGQVAIRFTSDHAWWTGYYLPPVFN